MKSKILSSNGEWKIISPRLDVEYLWRFHRGCMPQHLFINLLKAVEIADKYHHNNNKNHCCESMIDFDWPVEENYSHPRVDVVLNTHNMQTLNNKIVRVTHRSNNIAIAASSYSIWNLFVSFLLGYYSIHLTICKIRSETQEQETNIDEYVQDFPITSKFKEILHNIYSKGGTWGKHWMNPFSEKAKPVDWNLTDGYCLSSRCSLKDNFSQCSKPWFPSKYLWD